MSEYMLESIYPVTTRNKYTLNYFYGRFLFNRRCQDFVISSGNLFNENVNIFLRYYLTSNSRALKRCHQKYESLAVKNKFSDNM